MDKLNHHNTSVFGYLYILGGVSLALLGCMAILFKAKTESEEFTIVCLIGFAFTLCVAGHRLITIKSERTLEKTPLKKSILGLSFIGSLTLLHIYFYYTETLVDFNETIKLWGLSRATLDFKESYRLFSYSVIHDSWQHLITNTFFLWLGTIICFKLGYNSVSLISIYIFAVVLGGASNVLFSALIVVGASGGIHGLFGAAAAHTISSKTPLGFRIFIFSIIFLNAFPTLLDPHYSQLTHLGGFLSGLVIAAFLLKHRP